MRGISSHGDRSVVLEMCQNSRQQRPDWQGGLPRVGSRPADSRSGCRRWRACHNRSASNNRHRLLHLCRANSALAVILAA